MQTQNKGFRGAKKPTKRQNQNDILGLLEKLGGMNESVSKMRGEQTAMANLLRLDGTASKAIEGDSIMIDYLGRYKNIDGSLGEMFDVGLGSMIYGLGSGSMIDGFEKSIIGKKVGAFFSADATFPENYHKEDLRGKKVQFDIVLLKSWREPKNGKKIEELHKDYVKSLKAKLEAEKTAENKS